MALNFADALSSLKKKARLQGRPVSQQEVTGIAAGYSEQASSRLAKQRQLELDKQKHEETTASQEKLHAESLAASAKLAADAAKAADDAARQSRTDTRKSSQRQSWITAVGAWISNACIIITLCTSKDSYEVNISRKFRDKYMSSYHLGGYYALAGVVVPVLKKSKRLRKLAKIVLVDRLVDYGEWILEYKPKRQLKTSKIVTEVFLLMCALVGMHINVQPYIEAHK